MKKKFLWTGVLSVLMTITSFNVFSQKTIYGENGTPGFIKFESSESNQKTIQPSMSLSTEALKANLPISASDEFKMSKSSTDQLGFTHKEHQQFFKNIKVEFGTYKVHGRNNKIETANGHFIPVPPSLSVIPSLSGNKAFQKAKEYVGASRYMWESVLDEDYSMPEGELVIVENFIDDTKTPTLAYKFDMYAMEPFSRENVYISATNGQLVAKIATIFEHNERGEKLEKLANKKTAVKESGVLITANADTRYSGAQTIETTTYQSGYRLWDDTRGNGVRTRNINNGSSFNFNNGTDFIDNDNNWTSAEWDNSAMDNAALDAHWASEMTYDYYLQIHNRNSYDGNGTVMLNLVHAMTNWSNAQWSGTTMRYGDGNGDPLTTLDVGAHEMSHGVTSSSAGLIYQGESGALNEAFSDIFAAAVENYSNTGKQLWLVGEEIGYVRNMENPKDKGDPDTYQGQNWAPTSGADNGGVHTNSGVLNHWFYILSVGKSGTNDNGNSFNVTGLTIAKAEKIAYRILTVYLNQSSNYSAARNAGIQSAIDLYGAGSEEEIQTTNAFYAVGVGDAYDGGGDPDPDPEVCSTTISSFPYSESFESGLGDWAQVSGDDLDWTRNSGGTPSSGTGPGAANDGSYYLYTEASGSGTGYPNMTTYLNSPCFDISGVTGPAFTFDYHMNGSAMGTLTMQVSTDDGTTWSDAWSQSGDQGSAWNTASVDLSSFSGTIRLRFQGVTGSNYTSDMAIDNLSLQSGTGGPDPDPVTYCTSQGGGNYEYIAGVQFGTFENTSSGLSAYTDYTNLTVDLSGGSTSVALTPGFSGSSYTEYWAVWIDFNSDGDFTDAGEEVFTGSGSSQVSGSLTIPATATGTTRMRVAMKYNSAPSSPCGDFGDGETEDYTVSFGSSFAAGFSVESREPTKADKDLYILAPNPATNSTSIFVGKETHEVNLLTLDGKMLPNVPHSQSGGEVTFDLSRLKSGIYLIEIKGQEDSVFKRLIKE